MSEQTEPVKIKPVKKGDIVTLTVMDMGFEGKSVAKIDDYVVFLQQAVTGDVVEAEILKAKTSYAEGKVRSIIKPSEFRVSPKCTHTADCGGCKWQHVVYSSQLKAKEKHVWDALTRVGGLKDFPFNSIIGSEEVFFYRNKMEFSFSDNRWLPVAEISHDSGKPKNFALGLHVPGRFDKIVDIDECFLQSPESNKILTCLKNFGLNRNLSCWNEKTHIGFLRNLIVRQSSNTDDLMVVLVTSSNEPDLMKELSGVIKSELPFVKSFINIIHSGRGPVPKGEGEFVIFGNPILTEKLFGVEFTVHPNSFFQTNTKQAECLFKTAFDASELDKSDILYDLYCGPGTIGLIAANRVKQVIGIELVPEAIENAIENAKRNNIGNAEFFTGDVKNNLEHIQDWKNRFGNPTIIVVDPPRAGLHEDVAKSLPDFNADRILYISCNPMTQARDLKIIMEKGNYKITFVQPVDMFPHTYHIENIVVLKKVLNPE